MFELISIAAIRARVRIALLGVADGGRVPVFRGCRRGVAATAA